jgi:Fe2+ transport system protein FeoA
MFGNPSLNGEGGPGTLMLHMPAPTESNLPVPSLCQAPERCSLAQAAAGAVLKVRELAAPAEVAIRLRELGFCEERRVRLLSKHTNIICQVCNVRLGISQDLAKMIVVEEVTAKRKAS